MKAIFYNLLAWCILPVMDGIAKYLSSDIPVLQIVWARYFFTVVITLTFMLSFFRKQLVWTSKPKLQITRGLILVVANILFFYSISIISLTKALTLAFVAPLIVTALSPFFLGEIVGYRRWSAVIVGFVGSLIVIRPGLLDFNIATLAALGTGFFYGTYIIVTRKLHTADTPLLTLLITGVVGAFILTVYMPFTWVPPTSDQWLLMLSLGLCASLGHFFLILSLKYADASKLAPFSYFEIITNVLIGYYYFSDFPDLWTWVGLAIIVLSGVYISFREESIIR